MSSLNKLALNNEIQELIAKSKPILVENLPLTKIESDLALGNFSFHIQNQDNVENCINLTFYACHLNVVLDFLCSLINTKVPICTLIQDEGMHGIFYAELIDKNIVRFLVADNYELYLKFCQNMINYSFADCHIILDILIDKDKLVKQFYEKLWEQIKNYKNITYTPWGNRIDKESEKLIKQLNHYIIVDIMQNTEETKNKKFNIANFSSLITLTIFIFGLFTFIIQMFLKDKNAPIEYYYNDRNDNGYNYYNGDGHIDGALDNDYYYKVDETWHAVMLQHFTRHSILWKGGAIERETDEWMKNNADKFEKKNDEKI